MRFSTTFRLPAVKELGDIYIKKYCRTSLTCVEWSNSNPTHTCTRTLQRALASDTCERLKRPPFHKLYISGTLLTPPSGSSSVFLLLFSLQSREV